MRSLWEAGGGEAIGSMITVVLNGGFPYRLDWSTVADSMDAGVDADRAAKFSSF